MLLTQKKSDWPQATQEWTRLLGERISLAGIARALQVSEPWLLGRCQSKIYASTALRAGEP